MIKTTEEVREMHITGHAGILLPFHGQKELVQALI